MKIYKDLNNNLYAYESDGSQDSIIPSDYILITDEEADAIRQASILPQTTYQNKATASFLLSATDWTTIADVGNSQMANPYLANQAEFIAYRNVVRNMAVYPTEGNLVWPVLPLENWVKL
jgi:hypothetical protein